MKVGPESLPRLSTKGLISKFPDIDRIKTISVQTVFRYFEEVSPKYLNDLVYGF
jgi:hypothetical protein